MKNMLIGSLALCAAFVGADDLVFWRGKDLERFDRRSRVADVTVDDVAFSCRVTDRDPQLVAYLHKPFEGKSNQFVSLRIRSSHGGWTEIFWMTEKRKSAVAGMSVRFNVIGDGAWHDYRVRPCWCGEGKITALRLDPPNDMFPDGRFSVADVRIFEEGEPIAIDAAAQTGVTFTFASPRQEYATVTWRSTSSPVKGMSRFATTGDGYPHTYWFNFVDPKATRKSRPEGWQGTICQFDVEQLLAMRPLPVKNLRFVKGTPDLPPDPAISSVCPEEAIPRAGRPFPLEIILRNYGTRPVTGLCFAVAGGTPLKPEELRPAGEIAPNAGWDSVGDDYATGRLPNERRFRVTLADLGVGRHALTFTVAADGVAARTKTVEVEVKPSLNLAKAACLAEPQPVKTGPYEIGAFIFPGWDSHQWHAVWSRAPERKPVLGWYDETRPELVDWQIKHLVENGISYLFVDWYWSRGHNSHGHWPAAFKQARFRKYMKWALMWCNHNAKGTHSEADQEKVTKFWIENFFGMPEYMKVDGKPIVVIWDPRNMDRDLGPGGCRKLLEISRRVAKAAGYPGIHFIAQRSPSGTVDPTFLGSYRDMGFDETCVYKLMDGGNPKAPPRVDGFADYKWLADTSHEHWQDMWKNSPLPFLPSLTTAYDDRPWRGDLSHPVKDINPVDFRRICVDAKRFSDESGIRRLLVGPLDEWGEGSIAYPNQAWGFGMFEAVRDVFGEKPAAGWPLNYAPEDVGLAVKPAPMAEL